MADNDDGASSGNGRKEDPGAKGGKAIGEGRIRRTFRRLGSLLGWTVANFTSIALAIAIVTALSYALYNRGGVRVLPFHADDAALALQLGRALDDVAAGAQTGVNLDASLRRSASAGPPPVTVPGTNVSIAALFSLFQWGPLRETEIRAALSDEKDVAGRASHRMRLQVDGPYLSVHSLETDAKPTSSEAYLDGAQLLYEVLEPAAAAYYLFSRDANRALQLVGRILQSESSRAVDRVSAYHVWGLVLRDEGDYDGAREKLQDALNENERLRVAWLYMRKPDRERQARIYVDIGYVDRLDGRWRSAAEAFAKAAKADEKWAVPLSLQADMLSKVGEFAEASDLYEKAIKLDPRYPDPWRGLGLLHRAHGATAQAVGDFVRARRLGLSRSDQAARSRQLGELLSGLGCSRDAAIEWDRAVRLSSSEGGRRPDWEKDQTCKVPQHRDDTLPAEPLMTLKEPLIAPKKVPVAVDAASCRWFRY